jgi:hypothetical protein
MSLSTPVALIIFNRPDTTEKVFQAIRQAQPQKLFVIADGPRIDRPNEAEKCAATRAIIDRVDWDCEVLTNFSDTNLGCGIRISSGLDWVFSQVESAIILEDDCLPAPSFFTFCQELLDRYRKDERIMHISGNNFQNGQSRTEYSYYFSKYNHSWGWASWSRAWKHFDFEMKSWQDFRDAGMMDFICNNKYEQRYWTDIFERTYIDRPVDIWDYMWTYTCWSQGGLSLIPNVNLVSNIGVGSDATHTKEESELTNLPTQDIDKIYHPPFVIQHKEADSYNFDRVFGGREMKKADNTYGRLRVRAINVKRRIDSLLTI